LTAAPQPVSRLADILQHYDGILCDLWGVVHHGEAALPAAVAALSQARAKGYPITLLTNSPRPVDVIRAQLARLAVPETAYDAILSSGALVQRALARDWPDRPAYLIGVGPDETLVQHHPRADAVEDAGVIVACGLLAHMREDPEGHRPLLQTAKQRDLAMLCANADRWARVGTRLTACAGLLADLYQSLGGTVHWFGKPFAATYDVAVRRLEQVAGRAIRPDRVLAIGDSLTTDITGAANAGLDALFITNGIHENDIAVNGLTAVLGQISTLPRWIMPELR